MGVIEAHFSVYADETDTLHFLAVPQNKRLFYYATSAGRETLKRDYLFERENINVYMLNYIVRGRAAITVRGRKTELSDGDLTFLHLSERSRLEAIDDRTEIVYFHILGGQTEELYNDYLEKGDFVMRGVPRDLIEQAFRAFAAQSKDENDFYQQSCILYRLLTEILRLRDKERSLKYPKLIDRIMCHIMYACPPPSPSEVAEHFGFSAIYLERQFKKYVGESLRSFICKHKYAFACRFLTDTDLSVEEIAQKVGYSDAKGLIALFKSMGTLTPLAYRKQTKK